jgi:hypothetical protein
VTTETRVTMRCISCGEVELAVHQVTMVTGQDGDRFEGECPRCQRLIQGLLTGPVEAMLTAAGVPVVVEGEHAVPRRGAVAAREDEGERH